MAYVALHCVEASSLMVARSSFEKDSESGKSCKEKAQNYSEDALKFGQAAYGSSSEEFEIFKLVKKRALNSGNNELLADIQEAIAALRDIDS